MCELFAMSSRGPATVTLSLSILAEHGGLTANHKDGWGIAFYDEEDARIIKDAAAASQSQWVQFVEQQEVRSTLVISHIRLATEGAISVKNTQPFGRELGGRMHVFAHNGDVPGISVTSSVQHVVLVASVPLTTETWVPFPEGKVFAISHGDIAN